MTVYLDYNATAPIHSDVIKTVAHTMENVGNPSSIHGAGRLAQGVLNTARKQVAELVGCQPKQVTFTSGGTEANAIAILGGGYDRVLVGATEHDCVRDCPHPNVQIIPVLPSGVLDTDALADVLATDGGSTVVCVMYANNETGVINPIAQIAMQCVMAGAKLHVDGVQAVGKMPVNFLTLGCHSFTLSAHKIGGCQGVGALIADPAMGLNPLWRGGGQENRLRSGTENVAGIAGFGVACELANESLKSGDMDRVRVLRDDMEAKIAQQLGDGVIVAGAGTDRTPNTSCLIAPTVKATTQLMNLDLAGVMVSSGSACSSGTVKPSHVLMAMGYDTETAHCAIRVSLGWNTTQADVNVFLEKYISIIKNILEK